MNEGCQIKVMPNCRGGDDTQGALHAKIPLEPHGAANQV